MKPEQSPTAFCILSVAYPLFPVFEGSAGGAEQILYLIDRGLAELGHRSVVLAAAGSQITGELIETPAAPGEISDSIRREAQQIHLQKVEQTLAALPIDLIHFHGLDFLSYRPRRRTAPELATLHLPLDWYSAEIFEQTGIEMNFVSHSQAASRPTQRSMPVVANGIDVARFSESSSDRQNYLLWLGRICPEKGTDVALRVARELDKPLVVAGPVHPFEAHRSYFDEKVTPLLDEQRNYIGEVGGRQKVELLANAYCLLIPSSAAETSSLVAMEALAAGCPAVVFRSGALPEIIEDGVTGFVVESEDEMIEAVSRTGELSRETCRRLATARFSSKRMIADYVQLYDRIIRNRTNGAK